MQMKSPRTTCPCFAGNRTASFRIATARYGPMPGAGDEVIVHHTGRLHEGVANRRADEFEATFEEILAQGVRLGGARGHLLHRTPGVLDRLAADELPEVSVEAAKLLLHREKRLRVLD